MVFGKILRGKSLFVKCITVLVLQSFILSSLALAAAQNVPDNQAKTKEVVTDPEKIVVPREFGLVKTKFTGNTGKLVIHIQDAHCNYEAQSNIVRILENFVKNDNVTLVSVEGADGYIDTSWFKAFPDDEVRKEVATYFMKKGEITGPEFLSITSDLPIKLFGAETRQYYIQNLNAFTSSYPLNEETEKYYVQIRTVLNRLKTYIYTEELKLMDSKNQDYEAKKLQFNDYVRFLESMAGKVKINLREYDNFFKLISVLIYEKKIDFNVTDKERNALIDELSKKLSKDGLTDLVTRSLSFKVGRISSAEYYEYLRNLSLKNGIDLPRKYQNLYNYIIYNSVYSKIENEKLFEDIKRLEAGIKERLFKNDDQRALDKLSHHVGILLGLVNIKLLNGDFEHFKAHKDEYRHEAFADFIKKKVTQYGLAYDITEPNEAVANSITKLEDFYAIAIKRDKALVDNTLNAMKKEKTHAAVLVTGGFHSEGITDMLKKQGISYLVVCPSITKDAPSPYIQILTNQRTPFEEILVGTAQAKEGSVAPYLISAARQIEDIEAVNKLVGEVERRGLKNRVQDFDTEWADTYINTWLRGAEEFARAKGIISNKNILLEAFLLAVDQAVKAGRLNTAHRETIAALARKAFDRIYEERVREAEALAARAATAEKKPDDKGVREKTTGDRPVADKAIDDVIASKDTRLTVIFEGGKVADGIPEEYKGLALLLRDMFDAGKGLITDDDFKQHIFAYKQAAGDRRLEAGLTRENIFKLLLGQLQGQENFKLVLVQPKEEILGIKNPMIARTETSQNYGHHSRPDSKWKSAYAAHGAIDRLISMDAAGTDFLRDYAKGAGTLSTREEMLKQHPHVMQAVALFAHEVAEYLGSHLTENSVLEHLREEDIAAKRHYAAQYLEVVIAGRHTQEHEDLLGRHSRLDEVLAKLTAEYLTLVSKPKRLTRVEAFSSPENLQAYTEEQLEDLITAIPGLEERIKKYRAMPAGPDKTAEEKALDKLFTEIYNARLAERILQYKMSEFTAANLLTGMRTLSEFMTSSVYLEYLQKARNIVRSAGCGRIDLYAGAAQRLFGTGQDVDPRLSYFAHDVYDVARRKHMPPLEGAIDGISMGTRLAIQEWIDLEEQLAADYSDRGVKKAPSDLIDERKQILRLRPRIVIVNTESWHSIVEEFVNNDFYGYSPELTVFVMQTCYPGYDVKDGKPVLTAKSRQNPAGHGDATIQVVQEGRAFRVDRSGVIHPVKESAVDYLAKATGGRCKLFLESRVNDMLKLGYIEETKPIFRHTSEMDMAVLAYALYQMGDLERLDSGNNVIFELLAQSRDPITARMKGSTPLVKDGHEFTMETLAQTAHINELVTADKNAPFNRFYVYLKTGALQMLRETGYPIYFRFKDGYIYPEAVTSDLTWNKRIRAGWAYEPSRELCDYKDADPDPRKTLKNGVKAAHRQDKDDKFKAYYAELKARAATAPKVTLSGDIAQIERKTQPPNNSSFPIAGEPLEFFTNGVQVDWDEWDYTSDPISNVRTKDRLVKKDGSGLTATRAKDENTFDIVTTAPAQFQALLDPKKAAQYYDADRFAVTIHGRQREYTRDAGGISALLKDLGAADRFHRLTIDGISLDIDEELVMLTRQHGLDLRLAIQTAIKIRGPDAFKGIKGTPAIALLDKSKAPAEDHIVNNFIGINKAVFDRHITGDIAKETLGALIAIGITHELEHEAGITDEGSITGRDAAATILLARAVGVTVGEIARAINAFTLPGAYRTELYNNIIGKGTFEDVISFLFATTDLARMSGEITKLSASGRRTLERVLRPAALGIGQYYHEQYSAGKITAGDYNKGMTNVIPNLVAWYLDKYLTEATRKGIEQAVRDKRWKDLAVAYLGWTAFGTAGVRSKFALGDDFKAMADNAKKGVGLLTEILKGPNTINDELIKKFTLGVIKWKVADSGKDAKDVKLAVAYDSRVAGKEFADLMKNIGLAYGVQVYISDEAMPLPEFMGSVKDMGLDVGIYVSASHNPKEYNGVKIIGSDGAQLGADRKIREAVFASIEATSFEQVADVLNGLPKAIPQGQLKFMGAAQKLQGVDYGAHELVDTHTMHEAAVDRHVKDRDIVRARAGEIKILYCPFYGAGRKAMPRMLANKGFDVEVITPLAELDGTFPLLQTIKDDAERVPDPALVEPWKVALKAYMGPDERNRAALLAKDILFAGDADADRFGLVVRIAANEIPLDKEVAKAMGIVLELTPEEQAKYGYGAWRVVPPNEWTALIAEYDLAILRDKGVLDPKKHLMARSHVTSDVFAELAAVYGIQEEILPVGVDQIAELIAKREKEGRETVAGAEESGTYSTSYHVRDKDGFLAGIRLAEIACAARARGKTLGELLDERLSLNPNIGFFATTNMPMQFELSVAGLAKKTAVVQWLDQVLTPYVKAMAEKGKPVVVAGDKIVAVDKQEKYRSEKYDKDTYKGFPDAGIRFYLNGERTSYITIRPSGTEPKIRMYVQIAVNITRETTKEGLAAIKKAAYAHALEVTESWRQIAENMTFLKSIEEDVRTAAETLGLQPAAVSGSLAGNINKTMLLNDFAESVGIKKDLALEHMVKAGLATYVDKQKATYNLTEDFFETGKLNKFVELQVRQSGYLKEAEDLIDLTVLRIERIILNAVNTAGFLNAVAEGRQPATIAERLKTAGVFPTLVAAWNLEEAVKAAQAAPVAGETVKAEALANAKDISEIYPQNGVSVNFTLPEGTTANPHVLAALQEYQKMMALDMSRGGYNYRGIGTKQTVEQFYNEYFAKVWQPKIEEFVRNRFTRDNPLKAIVTNGIGANDQFMWALVRMYNENRPASAPVWYHVTTARDLAKLKAAGVESRNTLFIDISRSGGTWEGVEVGFRSILPNGFINRIALANGGAVAAINKAAANLGTYEPLIVNMSPDIGGRNMHRKTSIYYTAQTVAGMFLPQAQMSPSNFAALNDKFDRANAFTKGERSLAVSAGKFLHSSMRLLNREHIVFVTNTESLRLIGTEWEQYIMEGCNKEDVISMGIHDIQSEPEHVLTNLASSPAARIGVAMVLLDRSAPTYKKDLKKVEALQAKMPCMIFEIDSAEAETQEGGLKGGMSPNQQAAFDILWTDFVTSFTTLLRVDANSNPNVKVVREETAKRVAGWAAAKEQYGNDLIGTGETHLLASLGLPKEELNKIGSEGRQEAVSRRGATLPEAAKEAETKGKDFARRLASEGMLAGRNRINIFVGREDLTRLSGILRNRTYRHELLTRFGWIAQTAIFPLWSHKGLEANLAYSTNPERPLLANKTVNIFLNAREAGDIAATNGELAVLAQGFDNLGVMNEKYQQIKGATIHDTNDAMTLPNVKRMAEVSPTVLFEFKDTSRNVETMVEAFYEGFIDQLAEELQKAEAAGTGEPATEAEQAGVVGPRAAPAAGEYPPTGEIRGPDLPLSANAERILMSINQHKVEEAIREVRRLRTTPGFDENGLLTEMRGAVPLESSAEWADFMSRLSASAEKPEEPKLGGAGGAVAGPGAAGGREVAVTTSGQGGQIDEIDRILKKLTESEAVRPEIIRSIGTEAAGLRETLQRIFVSGIARKPVIITYDTALEPRSREAVQAGEKAVEGYLGGSLFVVRKTGKAVLAGIDEAVAELAKKIGKQPQEIKINVDYTLVTIAGDATLAVPEVAGAKDRGTLGKILNVQTDGRLYMPIIGMYDLALKIAYDFEPEKLAECLNRIALNTATGQPFTPEEVADFLRKGLIPVLPRIGPVDTNEAAAAYKAAQAVLQAL